MLTLKRRGLAALIVTAGAVAMAIVGACAEKKGALILAINTDMKAPKDVSAVSITVSTNGAIKHSFIGRVTPQGDVLLPATLAIVEPDDKGASIRVRVMAFQDRNPRVLRDVRTTVPSGGRTALLRIPLNFINDASAVGAPLPTGVLADPLPGTGGTSSGGTSGSGGSTSGGGTTGGAADFDFFGAFQPPCPDIEHQTIIDGECRDNFVDPAALPDFDESVIGDSTARGSCFDLARCFAGASVTVPRGPSCVSDPRACGVQKCDATLGCVECLVDGDCPASGPLCVRGSCSPCRSNADCGIAAPFCDVPRKRCSEVQPTDGGTPPPMGGADGGAAGTLLDSKTCTLQLNGADPARLNLALVTTDVGECVRPGECYVPIDRGPTGWKEDAGRVQLPLFVCKLLSGKNLRLATSTQTCAAKEESSPICRVVEGTGGSSGTSGTGGTSGTSGSSSSGGSSGSSGAGCVGQGCNVPMCKPGVHTTVVGSVTNPTIRARVYVPNGPLPTTCCSSNPKAITLATTDDMGNFTLVDPPVGPSVLIVIEQAVSGDGGTAIGWTALQRNISAPCAANDVGTLPAWDGTPQNGGVCCP